MKDVPPLPDEHEAGGAGVRPELYERAANPISGRIGRIASCAVLGGALRVLVAVYRVSGVRPLPDVDPGGEALVGAGVGALAGLLSLLVVPPVGLNPWTALRDWVREAPFARPVWMWLALVMVVPTSLAMTSGWATGATLEVRQLPATALGTVTGGSVTTTTRTRKDGQSETSTSSRVTYTFDVEQGPRAGSYRGSGGMSGSASMAQQVAVRYDPDAPLRNRLSDRSDSGHLFPLAVVGAFLLLWLALGLRALAGRGGRTASIVLFVLAHALPWAALGAWLSHLTFTAHGR